MKKRAKDTPKKKLTLQKETVKELSDAELGGVAGGLLGNLTPSGPAAPKAFTDAQVCGQFTAGCPGGASLQRTCKG